MWKTKNEMPIGSGSFSRKSSGAKSTRLGDAGSMNSSLYLKNASSARLKAMPTGSQACRFQCQDQEEVGSENRDGQQLDLKGPQRRQVIGRKYDRDEDAELPGSESHAAPTVVGETLASRLGRA